MRRAFAFLSLAAVVTAAATSEPPRAAREPREGYYAVAGTLPGGGGYEGLCSLAKAGRDAYLVRWYAAGGVTAGAALADAAGGLVVGFVPPGRGGAGVCRFRATAKGFRGDWAALPGGGGAGREEWEFLRPFPKEPVPAAEARLEGGRP